MASLMAEKKYIGKGKAYILKTDSDNPPQSNCQSKNCPLDNANFIPGHIIVEFKDKAYHASCATYEKIQFTVPKIPKRKRESD